MRRTQWKTRALFVGQLAGLGLFWGSFRTRSAGLAALGVLATALCGAAAALLRCPNCGARPPFFSRETFDLFNPKWTCGDCDHEL